jgi:hypothetical protein
MRAFARESEEQYQPILMGGGEVGLIVVVDVVDVAVVYWLVDDTAVIKNFVTSMKLTSSIVLLIHILF